MVNPAFCIALTILGGSVPRVAPTPESVPRVKVLGNLISQLEPPSVLEPAERKPSS